MPNYIPLHNGEITRSVAIGCIDFDNSYGHSSQFSKLSGLIASFDREEYKELSQTLF